MEYSVQFKTSLDTQHHFRAPVYIVEGDENFYDYSLEVFYEYLQENGLSLNYLDQVEYFMISIEPI